MIQIFHQGSESYDPANKPFTYSLSNNNNAMTNIRRMALAACVGVADAFSVTSSTRGLTEYDDLCTRQCVMSTDGCIVSSAHSALLLQGTPLGDLINKMNQCHDRSIPNPHFEVANQTKCESGDSDCVWNTASSSCEPDTGWLLHA